MYVEPKYWKGALFLYVYVQYHGTVVCSMLENVCDSIQCKLYL